MHAFAGCLMTVSCLVMNRFIGCQFSYCTSILMFHDRGLNVKMKRIQEHLKLRIKTAAEITKVY